MLYTLNYRTLPGTKNCREKYETKVKENSNEKTGRLFKESILSLNEDRAEEKQDPSGGELWRDQRGVKPQVREGRVFMLRTVTSAWAKVSSAFPEKSRTL
jgi:hypothetical protein